MSERWDWFVLDWFGFGIGGGGGVEKGLSLGNELGWVG